MRSKDINKSCDSCPTRKPDPSAQQWKTVGGSRDILVPPLGRLFWIQLVHIVQHLMMVHWCQDGSVYCSAGSLGDLRDHGLGCGTGGPSAKRPAFESHLQHLLALLDETLNLSGPQFHLGNGSDHHF